MAAEVAERRRRRGLGNIRIRRKRQGATQIIDILRIAFLRRFVEPFRDHQLGGGARYFAAVTRAIDADLHSHKCLRRFGYGGIPETERYAQPDGTLEQVDGSDVENDCHRSVRVVQSDVQRALGVEMPADSLRERREFRTAHYR